MTYARRIVWCLAFSLSAIQCGTIIASILVDSVNANGVAAGTALAGNENPDYSELAGGGGELFAASSGSASDSFSLEGTTATASANSGFTENAVNAEGSVVTAIEASSASTSSANGFASQVPFLRVPQAGFIATATANGSSQSSGPAIEQGAWVTYGFAYATVSGGGAATEFLAISHVAANAVATVEDITMEMTLVDGVTTINPPTQGSLSVSENGGTGLAVFEVQTIDEIPGITVTATSSSSVDLSGIANPGESSSASGLSISAAASWAYLLPVGISPQRGDLDHDGDVDADDIDTLANELSQGIATGTSSIFNSGNSLVVGAQSVFNGGSPMFDVNLDTDISFSIGPNGSIVSDSDFIIRDVLGTDYGDANLDGEVDMLDYNIWVNGYGSSGGWSAGDFNGDSIVDAADYTIWRDASEAAIISIPEPATVVIAVFLVSFIVLGHDRLLRGSPCGPGHTGRLGD